MNDSTRIAAHLDTLNCGQIISDGCARAIASQWHRGNGPLLALATTGAIEGGIEHSITAAMSTGRGLADFDALNALAYYVEAHGPRGQQSGWSSLWL